MTQISKTARTTARTRPSSPQIVIKSPFGSSAYMSDIILDCGPEFVRHGRIVIERGSVEIYRTTEGAHLNPPQIKVQTSGTLLDRNDRLKFYAWSDDGTEVDYTVYLNISLSPVAATGAVLPPNRLELLTFAPPRLARTSTAQELRDEIELALGELGEFAPDGLAFFLGGFDLDARDDMAVKFDASRTAAADAGDARAEALCAHFANALRGLGESLPVPGDDGGIIVPDHFYKAEKHARIIDLQGARNILLTLRVLPGLPERTSSYLAGARPIAPRRIDGATKLAERLAAYTFKLPTTRRGHHLKYTQALTYPAPYGSFTYEDGGDRWRAGRANSFDWALEISGGPHEGNLSEYARVPSSSFVNSTRLTWEVEDYPHEYIHIATTVSCGFTSDEAAPGAPLTDPLPTLPAVPALAWNEFYDQNAFAPSSAQDTYGFARIELKDPSGAWAELVPAIYFPSITELMPSRSASRVIGADADPRNVLPTGRGLLRVYSEMPAAARLSATALAIP